MKKTFLILIALGIVGAAIWYSSGNTGLLQGKLPVGAILAGDEFVIIDQSTVTSFSPGDTDVELLKFKVIAREPITSTGIVFTIEATGSGLLYNEGKLGISMANFTNLEVVNADAGNVEGTLEMNLPWSFKPTDDETQTLDSESHLYFPDVGYIPFNFLPTVKVPTTFILRADINNDPSLLDDHTTAKVTLDKIFDQDVGLVGPTLTATP